MTQPNISDPQTQTEQAPPTVEHCKQLFVAFHRSRKIAGAGKIAAFNGWTLAIFAFLSLAIFLVYLVIGFSKVALFVGLGLAFTAYNEFRGRRLLKQFNPKGSYLLGFNQLLLMAIVLTYCFNCVNIASTQTKNEEYAQLYAQIVQLNSDFNTVMDEATFRYAIISAVSTFYTMVGLCSIFFQGVNSLYYFSIRKHLIGYSKQTPPWAVELLKDIQR